VAGLSGTGALGSAAGPAPSTAGSGGAGGSSSSTDPLWSDSLTGPQTVLTAPAVNLLGARPGGYWHVQGTSFAAPLVAATAALIRSRYPGMSATNVINRLVSTARDLGAPGRDDRYGYGEVNPVAALRSDAAPVAANPLTGAPDLFGPGSPAAAPQPAASATAPAPLPSAAVQPSAGADAGTLAAGDDPDTAASGTARMSASSSAKAARMDMSVAAGGIVAAVLFAAGVVLFWRRRSG
jgi:subtilisin family serine protease